jgi:uncharacterized membrane protein YukC
MLIYNILRIIFLFYIYCLLIMFDFLAHWFAKTETIINNNGTKKEGKWTHFKNGHFSLDLTFISIVIVLALLYFLYQYRKQRKLKNKHFNFYKNSLNDKQFNLIPLMDIEKQSPYNPNCSESNVARAPILYPEMGQCSTKLCSKVDCNLPHT